MGAHGVGEGEGARGGGGGARRGAEAVHAVRGCMPTRPPTHARPPCPAQESAIGQAPPLTDEELISRLQDEAQNVAQGFKQGNKRALLNVVAGGWGGGGRGGGSAGARAAAALVHAPPSVARSTPLVHRLHLCHSLLHYARAAQPPATGAHPCARVFVRVWVCVCLRGGACARALPLPPPPRLPSPHPPTHPHPRTRT